LNAGAKDLFFRTLQTTTVSISVVSGYATSGRAIRQTPTIAWVLREPDQESLGTSPAR